MLKKSRIFTILSTLLLICNSFSCQRAPWQIPTELEIKSERLTPEQASKAIFGNYNAGAKESIWLSKNSIDLFGPLKGIGCTQKQQTAMYITTSYQTADISQKDRVALVYLSNIDLSEAQDCDIETGLVSVIEFNKKGKTWTLEHTSHIKVDLIVSDLRHGIFPDIRAFTLGKNNNGFIIRLYGGGAAGMSFNTYRIIARVGSHYQVVFETPGEDRYCPMVNLDENIDAVCHGMDTEFAASKCKQKFCP